MSVWLAISHAAPQSEGSWSLPSTFSHRARSRIVLNCSLPRKVTHGGIDWMKAKPGWRNASRIISAWWLTFPLKARATKDAPYAMASVAGLTGDSIEPKRVVVVTSPIGVVGENWPLVSP